MYESTLLRGVERGEDGFWLAVHPYLRTLECLPISLWQEMGSDWARPGLSATTFQNEVTVVKGLWTRGEGEGGVSPRSCPW